MRATLALTVLGSAALAAAHAYNPLFARSNGYPDCADKCIMSADTSGCSSAADISCLCAKTLFISATDACFQDACKGDELAAAEAASRKLCGSVGVEITTVTPLAQLTGAPASDTATDAAPSTTSADAPLSSSTAPASGGSAGPSGSGSSSVSGSKSSSGAPSGTAPPSGSAPPPGPTGAASAAHGVSVLALAGAALALLAL